MPLMAGAVLLLGVLASMVVRLGGAAVERTQARTAADAAALAGAAEDRAAAEAVARENGARLVTFEALGRDRRVVVVVGSAQASARATREATGPGSPTTPQVGSPGRS